MPSRLDPRAIFDRLQGTVATALGLLAVMLLFVYLVPRQGEIAAVMNARWERARIAANDAPVAPPEAPPDPVEPEALPPSVPPPAPDADTPAAPASEAAPAGDMRPTLLARPVVIDTATIMVRRGKVRLAGIQPVPMARKCGEGAQAWFCGVDARTRFRAWLLARSITCDVPAGFGERVETVESRCRLGEEDIGRWLVRSGWAEAVPGGPYAADEADARTTKLGVWSDRRLGG